jgi:hypothetical protein
MAKKGPFRQQKEAKPGRNEQHAAPTGRLGLLAAAQQRLAGTARTS